MGVDVASLSLQIDSSGLKTGTDEMTRMTTASSLLEGAIAKVVAAWATWKIGEQIASAATLAARYETLGVTMRQAGLTAGYSAVQMDAFEQALRRTGISMVESRSSLSQLAAANLDLAQSQKIARAAQDLAVVGGINSSEAFARVIQGIRSGQTEVLRTIGLNVQFEEGYKKLAAAQGVSVEQLSSQEKMQSRLNQVLQQAAGYSGIYEASMSTTGKQLLSMQRYTEDLEVKLGSAFGPALSSIVQASTAAIKGMSEAMDHAAANGSLQKFADGLGALTAAGISGLTGAVTLLVQHLALLEKALIAVAVASAYAWGPSGLAALGNIAGPLVSSLVGMVGAMQNFAATATVASVASSAWGGALALLASPITAIVAGLGAVIGLALHWDTVQHGNIDEVEAHTKALEEHIAKQKGWMQMREDGLRLEKQIQAMRADGGASGPASHALRVQDLVKQAMPEGKTYTADEMANATRYAEKFVALQEKKQALDRANEQRAAQDAAAAITAKAIAEAVKQHNEQLEREQILYEKGSSAALAYDLAKQKITGTSRILILAKNDELEAEKALAAQMDRDSATGRAEGEALQTIMDQAVEAYQAVGKSTAELTRMRLLDAGATEEQVRQTLDWVNATSAQQAQLDHMAGLQRDASRLNSKDDFQTRMDHLNEVNGTGILTGDAYSKELLKNLKSGDSPFAPMINGVETFGNSAADAFGKWSSGMDTAAIHWSSMIRSMIADMASLFAKQSEQQLFSYLFGNLGSLFGSDVPGGSISDTAGIGQSVSPTTVPTSYASMASMAAPAAASHQVAVTINNNGTVSSKVQSSDGAAQMGQVIDAKVREGILAEQRPGGLLNPL